jgi:hypothetical protein
MVIPDFNAEAYTSELFSEIDGVRTKIADEVLGIALTTSRL